MIEDGIAIDNFLIAIELPASYPIGIPVVRELGGRIPNHPDFHVFANGTLCLGLPEELWLQYGGRFELKQYLEGPLRSYFLGICEKLAGRPWPFGEWPHGVPALIEFYGKLIGTEEISCVIALVEMLSNASLKGHWKCPCGSGKELRQCHGDALRDLHARLSKEILARSLQLLRDKAAAGTPAVAA